MTGFGRGAAAAAGLAFVVEIRSVNHRGADLAVRTPREWAFFEDRLWRLVRPHLHRGRCEVALLVDPGAPGVRRRLVVDWDLAQAYHKALQELADRLRLEAGASAEALLRLPGVAEVRVDGRDADEDWQAVAAAAADAVAAWDAARSVEGRALVADLEARLRRLADLTQAAEAEAQLAAASRAQGLQARLQALAREVGLPAEVVVRAAQEAALAAERGDVSEELARIRSHVAQFGEVLRGEGPVGRRCEFLAQELAREWTTVGSKAASAALAALSVDARVVVEQLRDLANTLVSRHPSRSGGGGGGRWTSA
jgi:uncharacterized protein (TIGR00255 family)